MKDDTCNESEFKRNRDSEPCQDSKRTWKENITNFKKSEDGLQISVDVRLRDPVVE